MRSERFDGMLWIPWISSPHYFSNTGFPSFITALM